MTSKLKTKFKKIFTLSCVSALTTATLGSISLALLTMHKNENIDNTQDIAISSQSSMSSYINTSFIGEKLENTDTITYIYNVADLVAFRNNVNAGNNYVGKTVNLMVDIDLSSVCSSSKGSWVPIGSFSGTFDGNNHIIDNLYINVSNNSQGFFANLNSRRNNKKSCFR